MVDMLLTASEFSRLAGVSRQSIAKLVKSGNLVKRPNGKMDTDHPVNSEYISREREEPLIKKEEGPKVKVSKKHAAIKKESAKNPPRIPTDINAGNVEFYKSILDPANVSSTVKADIEKIKLIKQCRDLDLANELKRNKLIERTLVRGILSKKYEIDMASYLTIKDKLMPDIAAIFEINDPELTMKAGERMDEELWKILNHTKALFNKFLVGIKSGEIE
jgi:hypothetical protein